MSRTTGGPAEVLRKGSGIKVDGTAGDGLTISTYIKDNGNVPGKSAAGPIYHQRAQSNDFWLRAATRASFFTIRDKGSKEMDEKNHEMAHRRMVARRGILRNRGRNNNSPATGLADHGGLCYSVRCDLSEASRKTCRCSAEIV